jgi:phospholipid/cholesterol/gamma-HCH transport system substrate-binding protein
VKRSRKVTIGIVLVLVCVLAGGIATLVRSMNSLGRTHLVAYFQNSNGLFTGDEVRILGVAVGAIDRIEPEPDRVKIVFWIDDKYHVPADAKAAILSPQLVTARAIQLTPAYTSGPIMNDGAVIPEERTAVPVEWDDLRQQLAKLTESLQPTRPGGVSTLGEFVNTAADNLRGQGTTIRETVTKMSQALSILGDHSGDIFATIKNLSVVVSALHDSTDLLRQLNGNLAAVIALLADDPNEVGQAVSDLNAVVTDATNFIADNREALGTTIDKLASVTTAISESREDLKQTLHVAPNAFQNFLNIFQPSQASISGIIAATNFANPVSFLCGAIQAASRLGAEQSAKLCVQYLAPIIKNRQYNFPPLGLNLIAGESARPNEITYTEDWMRPDHVPTPAPPASPPDASPPPPPDQQPRAGTGDPLPAEAPIAATDPSGGLPGLMVPARSGS